MNRFCSFKMFVAALFTAFTVSVQATVDPENVEVVVVEVGDKFLRWQGQANRTYFVQTSDPNEVPADVLLQSWLWMSDYIDLGSGVEISHEILTTADRAFFRVWNVDGQPPAGVTPEDWDADDDGLSNAVEISATIQTNPVVADTDADGLPDGWEISHGLNPQLDDSEGLFQGGPANNLEAFQAGVQADPEATMDNFDGDSLDNPIDADPNDKVIDWERGAAPGFAVLDLDIPNADELGILDFTPKSTIYFRRFAPGGQTTNVVVDRSLAVHEFPEGWPQSDGEFAAYGDTLVYDKVLGIRRLNGVNQENCLWDPHADTYMNYQQWPTSYHDDLCDERNGVLFAINWQIPYTGEGLRYGPPDGSALPGDTIIGSQDARLEKNGNVVTDKAYWRWDAQSGSYGSAVLLSPEPAVGSATLSQAASGGQQHEWNLVVDSGSELRVSKDGGAFGSTSPAGSLAQGTVTAVTWQGWAVDELANKIWANGQWYPLDELLGTPVPEEVELMEILDTGHAVARIRRLGEASKIVLLLPVEIQVRKPGAGEWTPASELKIAKWETAWNSQTKLFRSDFIDSTAIDEPDRFRIRIDTEQLPEEYQKIYISSRGASVSEYNDDPTEVTLEHDDPGYGFPSAGFVSKPIILVADTEDNSFSNDNLQNDQTHIAALGSDVEFRIGSPIGDQIVELPVSPVKTVNVMIKMFWDGTGPSQGLLTAVDEDMKVVREMFAQVGITVNMPSPEGYCLDGSGVDLSDGLQLSPGEGARATLEAEGEALLRDYATEDVADVICLYIDERIYGGDAGALVHGIAIQDNNEIAPFLPYPTPAWDDAVSSRYRGTFLVSSDRGDEATFAHELGHILSLFHIFDEKVPHKDSHQQNILTKNPVYDGNSYEYDSKRFRLFQEERMHASQFVFPN